MPLILLNKPYQVLSQFSTDDGRATLADYIPDRSVYPAGRLDFDSEGLLALTDDGKLQSSISHPRTKLAKSYWVQVEGDANDEQLLELSKGVFLKGRRTSAVRARRICEPAGLWPRYPPIRSRKTVPDCWLEIVIDEGRNRQVRRMTAAVGLPALRLVRHRIGPWSIDGRQPGEFRTMETQHAWRDLRSYEPPPFA